MRESDQLGTTVPLTTPTPTPHLRPVAKASSASKAAFNAASGMARLRDIARTLSESAVAASMPATPVTDSPSTDGDSHAPNPPVEDDDEVDRKAVETEIAKWEGDGTEEAVDLLEFWTVRQGHSGRTVALG
ncbi:hypothetical protein FA13DRAFT_167993 [Coprinellus micaceus]|uniref:Uncharacterized protein n=1 Tax=Coprinellus micaceus TaxID=71717 RepID=A0A4Y7SHA7_COPMI|nr:hypothetical protein FA13DRAFT_167993 [Coprinellus micaceus]